MTTNLPEWARFIDRNPYITGRTSGAVVTVEDDERIVRVLLGTYYDVFGDRPDDVKPGTPYTRFTHELVATYNPERNRVAVTIQRTPPSGEKVDAVAIECSLAEFRLLYLSEMLNPIAWSARVASMAPSDGGTPITPKPSSGTHAAWWLLSEAQWLLMAFHSEARDGVGEPVSKAYNRAISALDDLFTACKEAWSTDGR